MSGESATAQAESVSSSDRREALRRVLSSALLRRSFRLRRFLSFVVETSLENENGQLTEQKIGVALFGRRPSYDTSADNIVRVNATELRKRLEQFYAGDGADETIIIEIPRGTYMPTFQRRLRTPETVPVKPFSTLEVSAFVQGPPRGDREPPALQSEEGSPHSARLSRQVKMMPLLALLLMLSIGLTPYQTLRIRSLEQQLEP